MKSDAMRIALVLAGLAVMPVGAAEPSGQPRGNKSVPFFPVVLAQAVSTGAGEALQPDFVLNVCKQTESLGDAMSAMRSVDPAGLLKIFIQNQVHHYVDIAAIKNVSLLEGTAHGKITSGTTNTGRTAFGYDPVSGYVGTDRAVFMAEYEGKRYKIVVQLNVFLMVDEKVPSTCPSPKLIKVNGIPVSDSSPYKLNSFTLTFGDLFGGVVGQTRSSRSQV